MDKWIQSFTQSLIQFFKAEMDGEEPSEFKNLPLHVAHARFLFFSMHSVLFIWQFTFLFCWSALYEKWEWLKLKSLGFLLKEKIVESEKKIILYNNF